MELPDLPKLAKKKRAKLVRQGDRCCNRRIWAVYEYQEREYLWVAGGRERWTNTPTGKDMRPPQVIPLHVEPGPFKTHLTVIHCPSCDAGWFIVMNPCTHGNPNRVDVSATRTRGHRATIQP